MQTIMSLDESTRFTSGGQTIVCMSFQLIIRYEQPVDNFVPSLVTW